MPTTRLTSRCATVPAALALGVLVAALARTVTGGGTLGNPRPLYGWYLADLALFAIAMALLRRVPSRHVAPLVLAGSLAVAATGLLAPPRTSDDAYRYVWDGRVQAAGISPYTYAPDAPALVGLRDPALFPADSACTAWNEHRTVAGACTHINRPGVHTIYPPVAEIWFLGLHAAHGTVRTVQVGGALLAVTTTGALLLIRRQNWRAGLWGWFPGIAIWSVNDAHVDTLGALLLVLGLALAVRRHAVAGGVALGAAIATKLIPALALPGAMSGLLARRPRFRDLLLPATALLTVALVYVPYVVASGAGVIGYLPGYLREEGYEDATIDRFGLLRLVVPANWAPYAAALVLTAVVLYVLRRGDPARPWSGALLVTGTALLLVAPAYPWYGLLVVALVALDGRWEWLAVPAAAQALYLFGSDTQQPAYLAALVVVLLGTALRRSGGLAKKIRSAR
ncbi:glycosyltransferase 87 family protein [Kitasatospora sp. GP82]|uniref:glycosyltransferase 87 family protein n=1 Tax=Kitasatospora sp. GP82 TaxID=3035089 RepID=UPI0024748125|nr:glycosyltransferase 87 family protein [Kitasatospora sp. GP82]MDH6127452.1 hypothetical protein [Kitasatospora sp. GP82]